MSERVTARKCRVCGNLFRLWPGYKLLGACSIKCNLEKPIVTTNTHNVTPDTKAADKPKKPSLTPDKRPRKRGKRQGHTRDDFYHSQEWLEIRYFVLSKYGPVCMLCNSTKGSMHVDHIIPRSKARELEYEVSNLQVLCKACNLGKSSKDDKDFRPKSQTS